MQVGRQKALDRPRVHEGREDRQHDRDANDPAIRIELDDQVDEDNRADEADQAHRNNAAHLLSEDEKQADKCDHNDDVVEDLALPPEEDGEHVVLLVATLLLGLTPVRGLGQGTPHVDGDDDRDDAGEEQGSPTPAGVHRINPGHEVLVDLSSGDDAEGVAGEKEARRLVTHVLGPRLDDVRGGCGVLACHREANDEAQDEQNPEVRSERTGDRPESEHEDRQDHRWLAPVAVTDCAEDEAADPAADEGRRNQGCALDERQAECFLDRGEREGDEDEVVAIKQNADPCGEEGLAIFFGEVLIPGLFRKRLCGGRTHDECLPEISSSNNEGL